MHSQLAGYSSCMPSGAVEQVGLSCEMDSAMEDNIAASTLPNETKADDQVVSNPSVAVTNPGTVRYQECQKNHKVSTGGHATDGCKGFEPRWSGDTELKCARCSCHRSFHRREVEPGNMIICSTYIPVLPLAWRAPADLYQVSQILPHQHLPLAEGTDASQCGPETPKPHNNAVV